MTAAVLEVLGSALASLVPTLVFMPIPADAPLNAVRPFGLSGGPGHRRFRHSVEMELQRTSERHINLLAMFRGRLTSVYGLSATEEGGKAKVSAWIGPLRGRADGSGNAHHVTGHALVLQVSLLPPGRRVIDAFRGLDPDALSIVDLSTWLSPLEPPEPALIIYEGLGAPWTANADSLDCIRRTFDGLPVGFPDDAEREAGQLPSQLSAAVRGDWEEMLTLLATRLEDDPTLEAAIIGHDDPITEASAGIFLSDFRAELFKKKLLALSGLPPNGTDFQMLSQRITTLGRLAAEPLYLPPDIDPATTAMDPATTAPNRRVEILLRRSSPGMDAGVAVATSPPTPAGQPAASLTVSITALDQAGRYLDPLELVRCYDRDRALPDHPLAEKRDPFAPSVASGWVRCVRDFDVFADGVEDSADQPLFAFHRLEPDPAGEPSILPQSVIDGLEEGDILWLDVVRVRANITVTRPVSVAGYRGVETGSEGDEVPRRAVLISNDAPTVVGDPADATGNLPIVYVNPTDPDGVGVRLLGLEFKDAPRGALSAFETSNLHVSRCDFDRNNTPLPLSGGAISLDHCNGVLIEDCVFIANTGQDGGAIFAETCRDIVIAGRALDPAAEADFQQKLQGDTLLGGIAGLARSSFGSNDAAGRGGAIAMHNSTFRIVNCLFDSNLAQGVGGAIAASFDEPEDLRVVKESIRASNVWPPDARSAISHCGLFGNSSATAGGQIALWGSQSDPEGLVLRPRNTSGGGLCRIDSSIVWASGSPDGTEPGRLPSVGGAILLASGVFLLHRNRISEHTAQTRGGGVACVADAYAHLRANLIDRNTIDSIPVALPEDVGTWGGGGIYAAGFSADDGTRVQLVANLIEQNSAPTTGGCDGGGVLATCGATVVCGGATSLDHNTFRSNSARSNGGAVSVRNADLEVRPGERFEENRAQEGDGGAIFFGGTSMYASPLGHNLYLDSAAGLTSSLCSHRGARLRVEGAADGPVEFERNEAGRQGAAVAVVQEAVPPLYPPAEDAYRLTAVNRTIGLLRTASIRHARFHLNRSDEITPAMPPDLAMPGSTILLQGLDNTWVAEYEGLSLPQATGGPPVDAAAERDAWIGNEPLGACELADIQITLDQGVGVLAVRAISVPATDQAVSVSELSGHPEGDGWRRYAAVNIDRPITP